MADVKVQQQQSLSRQEAARFIAALAEGLADDGTVTVHLGSSTLELSVAGQLDCELEVEVDGDEIELELELKWSTSGRASDETAEEESEDESEEDESEEAQPQLVSGEDDAVGDRNRRDAVAEDEAEDGESPQDDELQTPRPRRGRRSASAEDGKSAFNGVDTAAVRAWAAANGLAVSPRGRIKDEVLKAYGDAGN